MGSRSSAAGWNPGVTGSVVMGALVYFLKGHTKSETHLFTFKAEMSFKNVKYIVCSQCVNMASKYNPVVRFL